MAQAAGGRHFEAHIFFDGAVKDRNPTEFVLQLVTLVETVLGNYFIFSKGKQVKGCWGCLSLCNLPSVDAVNTNQI